jgi:hypothetical protein
MRWRRDFIIPVIFVLGLPSARIGYSSDLCRIHFQNRLSRVLTEKGYEPLEVLEVFREVSLRVDRLEQSARTYHALSPSWHGFGLAKARRLHREFLDATEELFHMLGIRTERIPINGIGTTNAADSVLSLSLSEMEEHYPKFVRSFRKVQRGQKESIDFILLGGLPPGSVGSYFSNGVIALGLEPISVLDLFLGGGLTSRTLWHEMIHAQFAKHLRSGRAPTAYHQGFKWTPAKFAKGYRDHLGVEEIYAYFYQSVWQLQHLSDPSLDVLLREIVYARDGFGILSKSILPGLKERVRVSRQSIQMPQVRFEGLQKGSKTLELHSADGFRHRISVSDSEKKKILQGLLDPRDLVRTRLDQLDLLLEEAEQVLSKISKVLRSRQEELSLLGAQDPGKLQKELLELLLREFRFLKKY